MIILDRRGKTNYGKIHDILMKYLVLALDREEISKFITQHTDRVKSTSIPRNKR